MENTRIEGDPPRGSGKITPNSEITARAREYLGGKWGFGVLVSLLYFLICAVPSGFPRIGGLIGLILNGPFSLGLAILFLSLIRSGDTRLERIFEGFNRFKTALVTYLIMILYILLWSLLLIIPGIIAAISYSMTFFILTDEPGLTPSAALAKSKQMMYGHKLKFFYLTLRFIPWALLCILTLGIGFLWLFPYAYTSIAVFYEDIKSKSAGMPELEKSRE